MGKGKEERFQKDNFKIYHPDISSLYIHNTKAEKREETKHPLYPLILNSFSLQ
jgi:hypothetical protein